MNLKWPLVRSLQPKQRESMIEHIAGKRTLGIFTLLLLFAIPAVCHALCKATLKWHTGSSIAEGYYVFGREEGRNYDYSQPWWQGDNTFAECTIDELDENKTYFFVIRAYSGDATSADSNEVRFSYNDPSDDDSISGSLSDSGTSDNDSVFYKSSGFCFISSLF